MDYFLKKKKWMACLVLLTFLFTSIMPTNLAAGDSMAWAAETTPRTRVNVVNTDNAGITIQMNNWPTQQFSAGRGEKGDWNNGYISQGMVKIF